MSSSLNLILHLTKLKSHCPANIKETETLQPVQEVYNLINVQPTAVYYLHVKNNS